MLYNPNTGYPPDWIDLKHLQSGLNKKLAGRKIDLEKASTGGCFRGRGVGSWAWLMGMMLWGLSRNKLKEVGDWIGVTDAGWVVCAAEVLLGIGSNGCGNLHGQHLWVSPSWDECLKGGYRIHICAYPQDEIEKMIDAIEICAGPPSNCRVSLCIHPQAHPMKPTEPPYEPPPYEPPAKSYINCTTSPSNARIWLKKH
jgi:hypothetical protein